MPIKLKNFLKRHNAYEKYMKNMTTDKHGLLSAFTWSESIEGAEFWIDLHDKFINMKQYKGKEIEF